MVNIIRIVPRVAPESLLGDAPRKSPSGEEPSLTLCSTESFFRTTGPLGRAVGYAVQQSSVFQRLAGAADPERLVRWTSQLLWVAAGEVPAARHEWHLDRVGPGWNAAGREVADYSDNAAAADYDTPFGVVSYFWPDDGSGKASLATEFLMEHFTVPIERLVGDPRTIGEAITRRLETLNKTSKTVAFKSNTLVWFGARTLHRPPIANQSGWRFFLRVGLYREPYSPYTDHQLLCHRLYDAQVEKSVFRPVGTCERHDTWSSSLSQLIRPCG